jgi:hypothetical protein
LDLSLTEYDNPGFEVDGSPVKTAAPPTAVDVIKSNENVEVELVDSTELTDSTEDNILNGRLELHIDYSKLSDEKDSGYENAQPASSSGYDNLQIEVPEDNVETNKNELDDPDIPHFDEPLNDGNLL